MTDKHETPPHAPTCNLTGDDDRALLRRTCVAAERTADTLDALMQVLRDSGYPLPKPKRRPFGSGSGNLGNS